MGLGGAPMKGNERRGKFLAGPGGTKDVVPQNTVMYRGGIRFTFPNYMPDTFTGQICNGSNVVSLPVAKGGLGFSSPLLLIDVYPLVRIVRARMPSMPPKAIGAREPTAYFFCCRPNTSPTVDGVVKDCAEVGWQQDLNPQPGWARACQVGPRVLAGEIPFVDAITNRIGRIYLGGSGQPDRVANHVWDMIEVFRDDE